LFAFVKVKLKSIASIVLHNVILIRLNKWFPVVIKALCSELT